MDCNYTVRMDILPLTEILDEIVSGAKEIHLFRYPSLDHAFVKLYSLPVDELDEAIAKKNHRLLFVQNAGITQGTGLHPLIELERLDLPVDHTPDNLWHLPNAGIQLTGAIDEKLFSKNMLGLVRAVNPEAFQRPYFPLAVYGRDGRDIYPAHPKLRNHVLNNLHTVLGNTPAGAYNLVTRSQMFYDKVPKGEKNGIIVVESRPFDDFKTALAKMLATDFDSIDAKIAYGKKLHEFVISISIQDAKGRPLLGLHAVPDGTVLGSPDKSGLYLTLYGQSPSNIIQESGISFYDTLSMQQSQTSVLIANYDKDHSRLKATDAVVHLIRDLAEPSALQEQYSKPKKDRIVQEDAIPEKGLKR